MKSAKIFACILFSLILFPNPAQASHMAGGEIWYEYIGDANNPHRYRVWLQFYRDVTGIGAPTNPQLCIQSSCFSNQTVPFHFVPFMNPGGDTTVSSVSYDPVNGGRTQGGFYYVHRPNNQPDSLVGRGGVIFTPGLEECVDVNSAGTFVQTEIYRYNAIVDLPGTCHDITFGFNENARNQSSNMNPAQVTFYIEAKLNNTLGPNSSPVFVNPAAKSFCVGSPFVWSQAADEPDNTDSLYYDFGTPLTTSNFGCPATPNPMTFRQGYSTQQPMSTTSGISIDHSNGTFSFTPSQEEVVVINVTVTEYRMASSGQYLSIGSAVRDLQIPVMANCKAAIANGPKLDFSQPGFYTESVDKDSIQNLFREIGIPHARIDSTTTGGITDYFLGVVDYNCFDTAIDLSFDINVLCSSISQDGSEFRLVSSNDKMLRPVVATEFDCSRDLTVKDISLKLHKPLDVNGDYFLIVKKGKDGNTITNRCGFELTEFYTMIIRVKNCPELDYDLENVTVVDDSIIKIDWWVDPSYAMPETGRLFTKWSILRAKDDEEFHEIAALEDPNHVITRSFEDTQVDAYSVDNHRFRYQVQLVQNFDFRPPTRDVHSILLTDSVFEDSTGYELHWTPYNGWPAPSYEVFTGQWDSTANTVAWENFDGPDSNYYTVDYILPEDEEGLFFFKVEATEPFDPDNNYVSESNWIYFDLRIDPEEKPDDPVFEEPPNVFTPDGDMRNDEFFVNALGYTQASIEVYNRWGTLVFRASETKEREDSKALIWDGRDMNSGKILADGTYYYVLELRDDITGETISRSGQVNIYTNQ